MTKLYMRKCLISYGAGQLVFCEYIGLYLTDDILAGASH